MAKRNPPPYTPWLQKSLRARARERGYVLRRQSGGVWSIVHADTGQPAEFGDSLTLDEVADIVLTKTRK